MADEDGELAREIAAGDEAAARLSDARFREYVGHLCRRAAVPAADCEDVVQEALMAAHRQLRAGQFRGDCALSTWLFRIARGCVADYWRRRSRMPGSASTDVPADDASAERSLLAEFSTPAAQENRIFVQQILDAMPLRLSLILRLNVHHGLTTAQIAPYLHLSSGRTGALLAEAKDLFRTLARAEEVPPPRRLMKQRRP
jgi:RNA polymerase sigma-70 factor (ECF subfamily)